MILGIDATNIRNGGGLTHLKEILSHSNVSNFPFKKVVIWASDSTLAHLPDFSFIQKESHPSLNKSFIHSFIFQLFKISDFAKKEECKLLFVPGGTFIGDFENIVSMSQNMLPFEEKERKRFKGIRARLRFKLLYFTQRNTFKKAKAVIFLTNYAKNYISKNISLKNETCIISHGISLQFLQSPKIQKSIEEYDFNNPFKLLYVSIITRYKHQWNVAEAVLRLREEGFPVTVDFIGSSTPNSLYKLNEIIKLDRYNCLRYKGLVPHDKLADIYKKADGFVFASSCENQPIILLEAMSAGLPIASSNMGPMPEVIGENDFLFDPLSVDSIYETLKSFLLNPAARQALAKDSYNRIYSYTWNKCSVATFKYLHNICENI